MHDQHRSPDPTKIERATATSTVALFIIIMFSGDLGVGGGVPFFHTQHHQNHGRTSFENKGGSGRILQGGGTSGETIGEQGKVCVLCVAGARARKSFFLICLYFHAF